jgi:hypothetical protein
LLLKWCGLAHVLGHPRIGRVAHHPTVDDAP